MSFRIFNVTDILVLMIHVQIWRHVHGCILVASDSVSLVNAPAPVLPYLIVAHFIVILLTLTVSIY